MDPLGDPYFVLGIVTPLSSVLSRRTNTIFKPVSSGRAKIHVRGVWHCLFGERQMWMLLQEHEIDSHYHAHEGGEVVPVQGFATKAGNGVDGEYQQGYDLLDDLQLE